MLISQAREDAQVGDINTKGVETENHEIEWHQPEGR